MMGHIIHLKIVHLKSIRKKAGYCLVVLFMALFFLVSNSIAETDPEIKTDEKAESSDFDSSKFKGDPEYEEYEFNQQKQLDIYGAKKAFNNPRPLLELGQPMYQDGVFRAGKDYFGEANIARPQISLYGDFRTAVAYNDNGNAEKGIWANRLNLDLDAKVTATERIHAFFGVLDENGIFKGYEFSGGDSDGNVGTIDANLDALFFEGDLGAIVTGVTSKAARFDLPIAVGLMPILFQNGIWVEDAFTGFAFTLPAKNSALFDFSNFDVTFFAGFDEVTSRALKANKDDDAHLFGVTAFIESGGYWEVGYGYTDDKSGRNLDYHNLTVAYSSRFKDILSNSVRIIANMGQDPNSGVQTADGVLFLVENSFITSLPSTLIPYLNIFMGIDRPQSLARADGAGGILKNTGINFETDGLTGFPKLDDTARDTYGAALGLEILGRGFQNQLVLEATFLAPFKTADDRFALDNQYALGLRYQHPITNRIILRADVMQAWRDQEADLGGIRFEVRYKF
jgi:hypothetical protein